MGNITLYPILNAPRWKAVCVYRTDKGTAEIVHQFEEISDLHDLVEAAPHWDTLISCTVTLARPAQDPTLTIERAAHL